MPEAAVNTAELDAHLQEVLRALHGAVKQGVSHTDDPKVVDRAIADCKEMLDLIMAGKVEEWLH
jgi:hypothetical protein